VYLTVYLFTVDQQNNFTLMLNCFGSSHVLTPVSRLCLKSRTFSLCLSLVSSRPNPKCLGSSHVSIPLSWPMSLSQKQCLDSITAGQLLSLLHSSTCAADLPCTACDLRLIPASLRKCGNHPNIIKISAVGRPHVRSTEFESPTTKLLHVDVHSEPVCCTAVLYC